MTHPHHITQAQQLLRRLEKIPVDSKWSHRASGVRASLAKELSSIENPENADPKRLKGLIQLGYDIAVRAAREISDQNNS